MTMRRQLEKYDPTEATHIGTDTVHKQLQLNSQRFSSEFYQTKIIANLHTLRVLKIPERLQKPIKFKQSDHFRAALYFDKQHLNSFQRQLKDLCCHIIVDLSLWMV